MSSASVIVNTWKTTIASAASPRSESNSAKRGLPGGGATAGEGAGVVFRAPSAAGIGGMLASRSIGGMMGG